VSGGLTPRVEETLVRLSTWMPFEPARELLQDLVGMRVSKATARRVTLATGQAALAVCEAQVERLKQEVPQAPAGAAKQAMSGDGAMVHLVGGEWVEVKTLALGEVTRNKRGEVCTQHLSYCSRLAEAERFVEAALVETHRRGLERAAEVCAVQDGAEWLQGLVDYHRADAVRILDFAHAAEYINEIGQAVQAAGGRLPARWLEGVLHRLKHQGPERVLTHLAWLAARYPSSAVQEKLTYLQKREAHLQYPTYQEAGWPIGSGSVGEWGKRQQAGRRSTPQRRGHAASVGRMSTPCSCCATLCAIDSGKRPGRQRWLIGKCCAHTSGKHKASSGWSVPVGSSSCGAYGCIGCLIPMLLLPPLRRLRPSRRIQLVVLALATPGTNPFSDVLLPPLLLQQRCVQKNETHPPIFRSSST
jgi:hypothetical protein